MEFLQDSDSDLKSCLWNGPQVSHKDPICSQVMPIIATLQMASDTQVSYGF